MYLLSFSNIIWNLGKDLYLGLLMISRDNVPLRVTLHSQVQVCIHCYLGVFTCEHLNLFSASVGPKISEMSPETKDKIRKDVQDAFDIAKKENGKLTRSLV